MPAQPLDLQPCMETALAPELLQEAPPAVATHHASLLEVDTLFFLKTWWRNGGAICLQAAVSWPSAEGLWWLPLPTAEQPTHTQQTRVYCIKAAKSTHKGEDKVQKLQKNWVFLNYQVSWRWTATEDHLKCRGSDQMAGCAALVSEAHDVLMFHMQTARPNQSSSVSYSESFHRSRPFPPDSDMGVEKANKQTNQEIWFWEKLILKEAATGVGISDASYWTLFTFWSLED